MNLDAIAKIEITTATASATQPAFGVPMILDAHTRFPERIRFYSASADMLTDGFVEADAAYLAAQKLETQQPRVEKWAVGRRANRPTQQWRLTPVVQNSTTYAVEVNGKVAQFSSDPNATASEIVVGLNAAIAALGEPVVLANIGGAGTETALTVTGNAAGVWVRTKTRDHALVGLEQTHADPGVTADLNAIAAENSEFYGVTLTTGSKAEIAAAAAWVEANGRIGAWSTSDSTQATTAATGATDTGAALRTSNLARNPVFYCTDSGSFPGAAALGLFLPTAVGKATLKFQTPAGVPFEKLTVTQLQNLLDRKVNVVAEFGGVSMFTEGTVPVGEFVDVIRDRDAFNAALQLAVFGLLKNSGKVPFTDSGIARVKGTLLATGRPYEETDTEAGFLAQGSFAVTAPRASTVPLADKSARNLTGVEFTGTIAGSIHKLTIRGRLSL